MMHTIVAGDSCLNAFRRYQFGANAIERWVLGLMVLQQLH